MGDGEAEIALVLPETPTSLTLALSVAAFGGEVLDLVLSHNGQQIGRHQTRINTPSWPMSRPCLAGGNCACHLPCPAPSWDARPRATERLTRAAWV